MYLAVQLSRRPAKQGEHALLLDTQCGAFCPESGREPSVGRRAGIALRASSGRAPASTPSQMGARRAWRGSGEHPYLLDNLWDLRVLVSYLYGRPDVDAARLGASGVSLGGMHAWLLAALEPRIAAAAPLIGVQARARAAPPLRARPAAPVLSGACAVRTRSATGWSCSAARLSSLAGRPRAKPACRRMPLAGSSPAEAACPRACSLGRARHAHTRACRPRRRPRALRRRRGAELWLGAGAQRVPGARRQHPGRV